MTQTKSFKTPTDFLLARVDEQLSVGEDDYLRVRLKIEAENKTSETILLDQNYHIPMNEASNVEAYDLNNNERLTVFFNTTRKRIEVIFKQGTRLPPGHKFTWIVKYKTSRFGLMRTTEQGLVTGIFVLAPRKSYKQISIQNHSIRLRVVFWRPKEGESFKKLSVSQSNNLNVPVKMEETRNRVICTFEPFDLGKGSKLRATFNYQSRSSSAVRWQRSGLVLKRFAGSVFSGISKVALGVLPDVFKALLPFIFRRGLQ